MRRFLFTLLLALLSMALNANHLSAGLIQTGLSASGNQQQFAGNVSSTDLINQGRSTFSNATESGFTNFGNGGGTPSLELNNGIHGNNTDANTNNGSAFEAEGNGGSFTVTYNLNTSVNTAGYDLTTIRSFAAHAPSRSGQAYSVSVDFLSDGLGQFVNLGSFDIGAQAGQASTMLTLQNDTNAGTDAFASGVAAIRFVTARPVNGTGAAAVWREFDVFGTPTITAVPEPSSILLTTLGVGAMVYYRHRRGRKAVTANSEIV